MKSAGILIVAALLFGLAGCAAEQYGRGIDSGAATVKVKDLYFDRGLLGRTVNLEGRISSQCGSNGCWFVLQDETGQIFVNLSPNNMTLPPRMQKAVKVTGHIAVVQNELQLIAQGVEIL